MTPYVNITLLCALTVLVIVLYGTYRCKTSGFTDPLTLSLFPAPWNKFLDGWGLTHLFYFMFLGYMYPSLKYVAYSWILGLIWEIIEFSMKDHPFYISRCKYTFTTDNGTGWWYGRWQDLVMNSIGLMIGYYLGISTSSYHCILI